jgi:FixJ family two-component response regulator
MNAVWIIDDDRSIRWVFEKALGREGIPFKSFGSAAEALATLNPARRRRRCWSRTSACRANRACRCCRRSRRAPGLPVIVMTAYSDLESAVAAFQGGAYEYLPKPFDVDQAVDLIRRASMKVQRELAAIEPPGETPEILGQAPAMQEVFRAIGRLSQSHGDRADERRVRHRQGTGRPRPAPTQCARRQALRRHQHRGHPARPARVRAVRPRARRLHRRQVPCAAAASSRPRAARCSSTRSATCRPNCRPPAARALRRQLLPRRRPPADQGQRARHRRHPPEPRGTRQAGPVPRGSVPSPQRHPHAPAAAARAARGHPAAGAAFPR